MLARLYRHPRFAARVMTPRGMAFDKRLVRHMGASLVTRVWAAQGGFAPPPALLLVTIGRRSGERREAVLPYYRLGETLYLIGSNAAKPNDPGWVANLRDQPHATIHIGRRTREVTARVLTPDDPERERAWAEAVRRAPVYAAYQASTSRVIPVIALR